MTPGGHSSPEEDEPPQELDFGCALDYTAAVESEPVVSENVHSLTPSFQA